jgi:hypothetical protein
MKDLQTIKQTVKNVMKNDTRCRNSDKWLIIESLRSMGFNIYVNYKQLKDMPSFESITRSRRYIQNKEKEYLPTRETDDRRTAMTNNFKEAFR